MGGATEQEASTRTTRFQKCSCEAPFPHGYFERMDGTPAIPDPAISKEKARAMLVQLTETGSVSADESRLIEEEINLSSLPEQLERDESRPKLNLSDLIGVILVEQEATSDPGQYQGPYSFRVVPERDSELPLGQFVRADSSAVDLGALRTKTRAREILDAGIKSKNIMEEEREGLLAAINGSELPEQESPEAIAARSLISFRVVDVDGERAGWFFKGKKRIRTVGPQTSKRLARRRINNAHPDYERLIVEIQASGLPE